MQLNNFLNTNIVKSELTWRIVFQICFRFKNPGRVVSQRNHRVRETLKIHCVTPYLTASVVQNSATDLYQHMVNLTRANYD